MVSSDIDIASQAFGLLRANTISSFNEGTNEADIGKLYYSDFAQDILTRHPWSFATKKRQLNQGATPLNEWKYSHIVPAETLRVWAAYSGTGSASHITNHYDIQTVDGRRLIMSNHENIVLEYTVYTDEANWPGYFSHFAIHAFAALTALPITDDDALAQQMHRLAWGNPSEGEKGGKFSVATGIDAQQKPPETIQHSPFIDARFS